jgi:N-methylhydantoinase B/oxoprolinase/acetone carboxylase alpha subunit
LSGGEDAKAGTAVLIDQQGKRQKLPGRFSIQARRGERIMIETPGGGGYGKTK